MLGFYLERPVEYDHGRPARLGFDFCMIISRCIRVESVLRVKQLLSSFGDPETTDQEPELRYNLILPFHTIAFDKTVFFRPRTYRSTIIVNQNDVNIISFPHIS